MSRLRLTVSAAAVALALGGAFVSSNGFAQQPSAAPDAGAPGDSAAPREQRREGRPFEDYFSDEARERWRRDGTRHSDDDRPRRWRERWRDEGPREFGRGGGMMMGRRAMRGLCRPNGERIVGFMLERLERVTRPSESQRATFDRLKEAAAKGYETVRAACPSEPRPITPPGRMAAAEKRLEAMLAAIKLVRPVLEEYYASLSEEQKARLYASRPRQQWREEVDRWRRGDEFEHRPDGPRQGWRHDEGRRERGWRDRDGWRERGGDGDRWRSRRDENRDGWPDSWRGRS